MQERHASGTRRTAAVRAALHAFAGGQLFGDAAGNRAGQRTAGAPAGNHEVHHRAWGTPGPRGNERLALDGRPKGQNPEHFPDTDEPAGKPRPFEHAEFVRTLRAPASLNHKSRSGKEARGQAPIYLAERERGTAGSLLL